MRHEQQPSRVIVITGASSGIGRAAAVALAKEGARLVLAARRRALLDEVARECEAAGGEALVAPCDVGVMAEVEDVAEQAVARFGRVDAWVHTAAVACFAKFDETPLDVSEQLLRVNVLGTVHAARAALAVFKRQGSGNLILTSSVLGKAPIPYLSLYNASKHAVVGLAESIRQELKDDGLDAIHVCTLMPPATDTPFYVHAANYVGKVPRPPPPVYDVDTLAKAVVGLVESPEDEVAVGAAGKLMRVAHAVAPGIYDAVTGPYSKSMFLDEGAPLSSGNVFQPIHEGRAAEGGWKEGGLPTRADAAPR